jgi:hypothetical protein
VIGLYASDPGFDYGTSLDELTHLGASSVLVLVTFHQESVSSPHPLPMKPVQRATLGRVLRLARKRGLRAGVIPILALEELAKGKWRGTIAPPSWDAWFEGYRAALLDVARIAARERAELLAVGSELCSSERHAAQWARTIAEVRSVFPGKLTYSSNWDHLPRQAWVADLDVLGLNAYYELVCEGQQSRLDVLGSSWEAIRSGTIEPWRRSFDRPLLFLEVGYPSSAGADRYPWDYTADGRIDHETQELLYLAFLQAWADAPELEGAFFYVWWEGPDRDPRGYTPRGKPAGELLRAWFGARDGDR